MKIIGFLKSVWNFTKEFVTESNHIYINTQVIRGNREAEDMINNYYWNWEEYKL